MRRRPNVYTLNGMKAARRQRRTRAIGIPAAVLIAAAAVGGLIGVAPGLDLSGAAAVAPGYSDTIAGCRAIDGDTLRCGDERIRLIGIDTPEMPGHCRPGRDCAPGDPHASQASLAGALVGTLRIERVGEDHYGRTLAIMAGDKGDLSCWQLRHGQARYEGRWDDGMRVAHACPSAVLP